MKVKATRFAAARGDADLRRRSRVNPAPMDLHLADLKVQQHAVRALAAFVSWNPTAASAALPSAEEMRMCTFASTEFMLAGAPGRVGDREKFGAAKSRESAELVPALAAAQDGIRAHVGQAGKALPALTKNSLYRRLVRRKVRTGGTKGSFGSCLSLCRAGAACRCVLAAQCDSFSFTPP